MQNNGLYFQSRSVRVRNGYNKVKTGVTVDLVKATQGLTDKQREVLDLLIEHKTSKEIARSLGISPYTVDQRIASARRKLGAKTRNELAAVYKSICGELVYQFSHVDSLAKSGDEGSGSDVNPIDESGKMSEPPVRDYRVVPEIFEGRYGAWFRLGAISIIALLLLITGLGGVAAFAQLSDVLSY
ncbi:helix-turn-helix transcriptional regulator [Aurantiacibacter poecillastricola]|uniref:helix-turn-helix transcriptional regulator n=1 Tax=Aurantiacibacter poecillastricola TaxID=3064385 RepID=UPI00273ED531|nr:helix-turn-helix transcriptional regulator [Aurantiacibacter sp. 219JJ12-13]MDP5261595.1 helix-turn-helix transcriptional regulator [Aurantiacibacter sp. 219JJ12-13]